MRRLRLRRSRNCDTRAGAFRAMRCGWGCRGLRCRGALRLCRANRRSCSIRHTIRHRPARWWKRLPSCPLLSRRTLILSISHDKDVRAIVRELVGSLRSDHRHAVSGESPCSAGRTCFRRLFAEKSRHHVDLSVCPTPREAWQFAVGICGAARVRVHCRFVLSCSRVASARSSRGHFGIAQTIMPRARVELSLPTHFVLQVLDQLSNVRVGPRQHVASQRAARHGTDSPTPRQPHNELD